MRSNKTYVYKDKMNDNFSERFLVQKSITGKYRYSRNTLNDKFLHTVLYKLLAVPFAKRYMYKRFDHEIVGAEKLINQRGAYFLYGNHTHALADACIPSVAAGRDISIVVEPRNLSFPIWGKIKPYLGALPLPSDEDAAKNFVREIKVRMAKKQPVMLYPEKNVWPYYTDIRPFPAKLFRFPVQYNKPTCCITNTYQATDGGKGYKIVSYVDGPIYPAKGLEPKESVSQLRDLVYLTMKKRALNSNIELANYVGAAKQSAEDADVKIG